jgi:hypothetical protein
MHKSIWRCSLSRQNAFHTGELARFSSQSFRSIGLCTLLSAKSFLAEGHSGRFTFFLTVAKYSGGPNSRPVGNHDEQFRSF